MESPPHVTAEGSSDLAWRRRCLLAAALAVCVSIGAACRHGASRTTDIDLVSLFRSTASSQDTIDLAFGAPEAMPYLGEGWSAPEPLPSGQRIRRAVDGKASVSLNFSQPAARVLSLRCAALAMPAHRRRDSVTVRLNGRRVAEFEVQPEMGEHRISLPAAGQQAGTNELAFSTRQGRGPERLDVAYASLAVLGASGERRAAAQAENDRTLLLPPGSAANYFVRLPEDAAVHVGTSTGSGRDKLEITLQPDGAAARTVFTGAPAGANADIPLHTAGGAIVRLTLANAGDTALRLVDPQLRGSQRALPTPAPIPRNTGYNVLLYVIDTLRADHLGCYGYGRPTSPQLDALARDSALFTDAFAQASWTRSATASILTGRYPQAHGATTLRSGLRPGIATLAELLQEHGYRTGAFVTSVNVAPQWGFQRGFETYRYLAEDENSPTVHVGSDVLNAHALEWLTTDQRRPFFLYLHATDPHSPYRPPPPWAERLADGVALPPERLDAALLNFRQHDIGPTPDEVRALTAAYDGEVAFTDENLGHLLAELRRLGLYDRTLILVIADHGEEFADHGGLEHGRTLYEEMLHVPLIVRAPGAPAGTRVAARVQQIDVVPTILDYLSIPGPADLPGRSLLPGIAGAQLDPVDAFAETALGRRQVLDAVVMGDWKVIRRRTTSAETVEAYDLGADPGERGDRGMQRPVLLGYARQALAAWATAATTDTSPAIESPPDPALMERLRALGYAD